MGRRVVLQPECPPGNFFCDPPTLIPNNRLLTRIASVFGVETDTFGYANDPKITQGRLDEL